MPSDLGFVGQWVYSKLHTPILTFLQIKKSQSAPTTKPAWREGVRARWILIPIF